MTYTIIPGLTPEQIKDLRDKDPEWWDYSEKMLAILERSAMAKKPSKPKPKPSRKPGC